MDFQTITTTNISPNLGELAEILVHKHDLIPCFICFSTFFCSGWTPLPPHTFPQIWESFLKSWDNKVCKQYHYDYAISFLVRATIEAL
jgi:hypothetical protein